MSWRKSPPELIGKFEAAFPDDPRAMRRLMFGFPAGFSSGHMFAGLWQEFVILRLADAARHELLKLPGSKVFEPMEGRPMREYVIAPPSIVDDPKQLRRWLLRALDYATSLPPKKPKKPRKSPAKKPKRKTTT